MSDFKVHTPETAPQGSRATLEAAGKAFGFIPNLYGVLAGAPAAVKTYAAVSEFLGDSSFDAHELQVVLLSASFENGCDYCMAAHSTVAAGAGLSGDVIGAVREGREIHDPRLQALSTFTRTVVAKRGELEDGVLTAFLDAGFSRQQVLEVLTAVSLKTLSNYTNHLAHTPLDEPFRKLAWTRPTV